MTVPTIALPHFKDQYERLVLLVEGITVDSVAEFDLETCRADEPAVDVLERMKTADIDQMPVDPERASYVVRDSLEPGRYVRDAELKPFAAPDLIAAGTPLSKAYTQFLRRKFLFVLRGTQVEGIVTRGDFQRAPFRMYLFGLLGLLEMGIARLVESIYGDEGWQRLPGAETAREEAARWYRRAVRHGEEPRTRFEVISLASKLNVLRNAEKILQGLDDDVRQLILTIEPSDVKKLRDNLAHAKDLTAGLPRRWSQVYELAEHLEKLTAAIAR